MSAFLYGSGLQPERTLLAWRRTCLALALGVAVAIRYEGEADPISTIVVGIPALSLLGVAYAATAVRYRAVRRSLDSNLPHLASAGGVVSLLVLATLGIGIVALRFVIVRGLG